MKRAVLPFLSSLAIACATSAPQPPNDNKVRALAEQVAAAPDSVTFAQFWNAYLDSAQVLETVAAQQRYAQTMSEVESGQIACTDLDWDRLTGDNLVALMPRVAAVECLESAGRSQEAAHHQNLFNFVVSGILSQSSGEAFYNAYEIASWADAEELLNLSGYEIIDSKFEFQASRNGLYRVYNVRARDSGQFSRIYFDNSRFLHRVLNGQYPFAGLSDAYFTSIIQPLAETDFAARHAEGIVHQASGNYGEAEIAYLDAIAMGSVSANIDLGNICLESHSSKFTRSECAQLFVTASELGIEDAKVTLAYISLLGLGIEADPGLAQQLLDSAAASLPPGEPEYKLAILLSSNRFAEPRPDLAKTYLQSAVTSKHPKALYLHAMAALEAIRKDSNNKENQEQFIRRIKKAARAGYAPAQFVYARYLLEGEEEIEAGLAELDKAATAGYPAALYERGTIAEWGRYSQPKSAIKAFFDYQAAGLRWHAEAQFALGHFNDKGKAVEVDRFIAYGWFSLCAEAGHLGCINNLGYANANGRGVPRDYVRAAELYRLASERGDRQAANNLGQLYERGLGVDKDLTRAIELYTTAAEGGWVESMNTLGSLHLKTSSPVHDYGKALHWFEQSAKQNSAEGLFQLGRMYEQGLGVAADTARAKALFLEASEQGHQLAKMKFTESVTTDTETKTLLFECQQPGGCDLTVEEILEQLPARIVH
ncbi:tetratricopeptide repeat protein [Microbulbifer aggregans]|nr:SEL1-like repeat protein [Microbulbifer aggregans]